MTMKVANPGQRVSVVSELARGFRKFRKRWLARSAEWSIEPVWGQTPEALAERAHAFFRAQEGSDSQSLLGSKIEAVRQFDVAGMERVAAICRWGSSGSLLLASYLDGHEDVIMLGGNLGTGIYPFFECHRSLSLRDKLLAYPFVSIDGYDHTQYFFQGNHAVAAADYYAAVNALLEVYGDRPPEFLESRRTFFQFLHIVCCVASGQRPAGPHPLMVYSQSQANDLFARFLIEDFPQARFIHTVRDPITNVGRLFEHDLRGLGLLAAVYVIAHLAFGDRAHPGMESRTRAIRFEDLHLHLEETMGAVAAWFGIAYRPSLLESTFNGRPFFWKPATGTAWSGARPEKAARDSRNVSFTDRSLLFTLFTEDFVAWDYPCPKFFTRTLARVLTFMLVVLIPMKMEFITARIVFKSFVSGNFRSVFKGLAQICTARVAIMSLVAAELYRRLTSGKRVLELLPLSSRQDANQPMPLEQRIS